MDLSLPGSTSFAGTMVLAAVSILVLAGTVSAQADQGGAGFERTFSPVKPDNGAYLKMLKPFETGVWSMNISVSKTVRNASISISSFPNSSTAVPAPGNMVYRYLNVSSSKLNSSTLSRVEIVFPVNRSWAARTKESSIQLNILEDGEWQPLETKRYGEEVDRLLYLASSSSVSYFAVTAERGSGISFPPVALVGAAVTVLLLAAYFLFTQAGGARGETRVSEQRLENLMQEIQRDLKQRPVQRREELNSRLDAASELIDADEYEQAEQILQQVKDSIENDDY